MSTLSTRTLAALAFERGEEFDPALTLPSGPLAEDLGLLAGARPGIFKLSPAKPRQMPDRALRDSCATDPRELALGHLARARHPRAPRPK
jgi:hypothetical protein